MNTQELTLRIKDCESWYETEDGERIDYVTAYNVRELCDDENIKEYEDAGLDFVLHRVRHMLVKANAMFGSTLDNTDYENLLRFSEQCEQVAKMLDAFAYDCMDETADELQVGTKPYLLGHMRDMMNDASFDTWYCAKAAHGMLH